MIKTKKLITLLPFETIFQNSYMMNHLRKEYKQEIV